MENLGKSYTKICKNCKKQYITSTDYSAFCSDECLKIANNYKNYPIKDERNGTALAVGFISMIVAIFSVTSLVKSNGDNGSALTFLMIAIAGFVYARLNI
jgi:hypothetical protein